MIRIELSLEAAQVLQEALTHSRSLYGLYQIDKKTGKASLTFRQEVIRVLLDHLYIEIERETYERLPNVEEKVLDTRTESTEGRKSVKDSIP